MQVLAWAFDTQVSYAMVSVNRREWVVCYLNIREGGSLEKSGFARVWFSSKSDRYHYTIVVLFQDLMFAILEAFGQNSRMPLPKAAVLLPLVSHLF